MLGAGFLWISLTCLGAVYAHRLKSRITLLEKTQLLINKLKVGTEFLGLSAYEILKSITDSEQLPELDYIDNTKQFISLGEDFPVAWNKGLKDTSLEYTSEEKEMLLNLGENLGTSDIKNQVAMLEMYEKSFCEFSNAAKSRYSKQAKTVSLSTALVGCMLFISLI